MEIDETERPPYTESAEGGGKINNYVCAESLDKDSENISESQEENDPYFEEFFEAEQIKDQFKRNDPNATKNWGNLQKKRNERATRNGVAPPEYPPDDKIDWQGNKPTDFAERELFSFVYPVENYFEKQEHIQHFIVTCFRARVHGKVFNFEKQFYFYDGGYFQKAEETQVGWWLAEFGTRLGFKYMDCFTAKAIKNLLEEARIQLFHKPITSQGFINFPNGTLDIERNMFIPHRVEDDFFYALPFDYDPTAKCPLWHKVISEWLPEDVAKVAQEAAGHILLGKRLRIEKIPMCVGDGRNGKSVYLTTLANVCGKDNVSCFSLDQMTDKKGEHRAGAEGKIVNIAEDCSPKISDPYMYKLLASQSTMPVKNLYCQPRWSDNVPPTMVAMNALPIVEDFSEGGYRRLLVIPFEKQIPLEAVDVHLISKLKNEVAGVFNWMVEGATRLMRQEAYSDSPTCTRYMNQYRTDSDSVALFAEELGYQQGDLSKTLLKNVYEQFKEWAKANNHGIMTSTKFGKRLRGLKFRVEKFGGQTQVFHAPIVIDGVDLDSVPF
ncbi:MAG: phage/plasmid primase, P4 family [Rikenellaceae bacterium]